MPYVVRKKYYIHQRVAQIVLFPPSFFWPVLDGQKGIEMTFRAQLGVARAEKSSAVVDGWLHASHHLK